MPLIRLLGQASPQERQDLLALLKDGGEQRGEILRDRYRQSDAIEYAYRQAADYARCAARELDGLTSTTARAMLAALAEFVVERRIKFGIRLGGTPCKGVVQHPAERPRPFGMPTIQPPIMPAAPPGS